MRDDSSPLPRCAGVIGDSTEWASRKAQHSGVAIRRWAASGSDSRGPGLLSGSCQHFDHPANASRMLAPRPIVLLLRSAGLLVAPASSRQGSADLVLATCACQQDAGATRSAGRIRSGSAAASWRRHLAGRTRRNHRPRPADAPNLPAPRAPRNRHLLPVRRPNLPHPVPRHRHDPVYRRLELQLPFPPVGPPPDLRHLVDVDRDTAIRLAGSAWLEEQTDRDEGVRPLPLPVAGFGDDSLRRARLRRSGGQSAP